jgi:hypothetical protein
MKVIKEIDTDSYLVELDDGRRGTMNRYSRNFMPFEDSTEVNETMPMYGDMADNSEALSTLDSFIGESEEVMPLQSDYQEQIGDMVGETAKDMGYGESIFRDIRQNVEFDLGGQTAESGEAIFPDLENKSLSEIMPEIAESIKNNTFNSKFVQDMISESIQANDPGMGALSSDLAIFGLIGPKLGTWFKGLTKIDDVIRKGINMVKTWKSGNKEFGEFGKREGIDPKNMKEAEMLMDKASSLVTRAKSKPQRGFGGDESIPSPKEMERQLDPYLPTDAKKPFDMKKSIKEMEADIDADILGFYQNLGERVPRVPTASETAKFDQQRAIMTHLLDMDDMNVIEKGTEMPDDNIEANTMELDKNDQMLRNAGMGSATFERGLMDDFRIMEDQGIFKDLTDRYKK